ncbi:hypothetical protein SAPIO_CDS4299 [Scedosporium apiospermum]|uniref:NACHT domain-containing protein n=1 Tax=Pseudallescheria apiosperma TaxID=563466 RepID=A0A084G8M0_PSEDA|nr:uncharacterized protein SAPIO_CDS4299 [Scedosporium apiospermum]KEZ43682.1 hypothetical protein SAPIO_CDS4299 [Scedosporium apiospermum]
MRRSFRDCLRPKSEDSTVESNRVISNSLHDGIGPLVVFDNISNDDTGTDIVFVHGLRGSRINTWSKDNVFWPEKLLREDLQNVRVITWGYDARIANAFRPASQDSLFGHSNTLLEDLSRLQIDMNRPIIFICHSLGGLLVKEALITSSQYHAHERHPPVAAIYSNTIGVIFLGTPHRGSGKRAYGEILSKIAKLTLRRPNAQLLRVLWSDSDAIERQRHEFTTVSKMPKESAIYDGFNVRQGAINANHMEIARFVSSTDQGYQRILGYIKELLLIRTPDIIGDLKLRQQKLLEYLRFPSMLTLESSDKPAHMGTCDWAVKSEISPESRDPPAFMSWTKNEEPLFWISGKAASGKSTLMKYLYYNSEVNRGLREWAGDKELLKVGYFFLDSGNDIMKCREGMLRSFLFQILEKRRQLIGVAFPSVYNQDYLLVDEQVNSWANLSRAFIALLNGLETFKVCLFIDGLDEYRMKDRLHDYASDELELITEGSSDDEAWGINEWIVDGHMEIAKLILSVKDQPNVKICCASRQLNVFESRFAKIPRLQIHHHTAKAIEKYCQERLEADAPDLDKRSDFAKAIADKSLGVFLWVRLVVDALVIGNDKGDTESELWQALERIPQKLNGKDGLYMMMLQKIARQDRCESAKLFQLAMYWHASGVRRGNLDILTICFAGEGHLDDNGNIRAKQDKIDPKALVDLQPQVAQRQRRLRSRCAGLLEDTGTIQFMHLTAKEFLSQPKMWDLVFKKEHGFRSHQEIPLALMSGIIRRLKCCEEASTVSVQSCRPPRYPTWVQDMIASCLELPGEDLSLAPNLFKALLDELDYANQNLVRIDGVTWVEIFCCPANSSSFGEVRPTSMLEVAMSYRCLRPYVILQVRRREGISQDHLARLLSMASFVTELIYTTD